MKKEFKNMSFKKTFALIFLVCRYCFVFGQITQGIIINNVVLPYTSESIVEDSQNNKTSDNVQITGAMDLPVLNTNTVRMLQLAI